MSIITLIRIEDGKKFQGFLDWEPLNTRQMNFYFFDEERNAWTSLPLGRFKPIPLQDEKREVIGE